MYAVDWPSPQLLLSPLSGAVLIEHMQSAGVLNVHVAGFLQCSRSCKGCLQSHTQSAGLVGAHVPLRPTGFAPHGGRPQSRLLVGRSYQWESPLCVPGGVTQWQTLSGCATGPRGRQVGRGQRADATLYHMPCQQPQLRACCQADSVHHWKWA